MESIKGTGPAIADLKSPLNVVGYGHDVLSESEFPYSLYITECQYKTVGFYPWKLGAFSAFLSVKNAQDWTAIFISAFRLLKRRKMGE